MKALSVVGTTVATLLVVSGCSSAGSDENEAPNAGGDAAAAPVIESVHAVNAIELGARAADVGEQELRGAEGPERDLLPDPDVGVECRGADPPGDARIVENLGGSFEEVDRSILAFCLLSTAGCRLRGRGRRGLLLGLRPTGSLLGLCLFALDGGRDALGRSARSHSEGEGRTLSRYSTALSGLL